MAGQDASLEGLLDRGLAEFLDWFAHTKRAWELEEMVRDLIPADAAGSPQGAAFADAIITRLATTPVGVSALHVMGMVAMPLVALKARSAVERVIDEGGPKPSSLARRCGGLAPTEAWRLSGGESDGDGVFLLVCRRPKVKSIQLAIVATMDTEDGPILIEASLASPLPESDIGELLSAFDADGAGPVPLPMGDVAAQIVSLAKNNIATGHGPTAQALPVLTGLAARMDVPAWEGLLTALSQLPLAEAADDEDDEDDDDLFSGLEVVIDDPPALSDAEVKRIEKDRAKQSKRFVEWFALREDDPDRREHAAFIADAMFDYCASYRNGDPWDEGMLHEALMGHLPRTVAMDEADMHATPSAVFFVVQFLGETGQVSDATVERMTEELHELAPEFILMMADTANFGTAKRLVHQMELEGFDSSQADELHAWMADFNARPFEERADLIPGTPFATPPGPAAQPWAGDAPRPKRQQDHAARKRSRRRGR